jgi:glutamate-1-semialdehyde 2,1-aminomutase
MSPRIRSIVGSERLYKEASRFITGGVHSSFRYQEPHPRYFTRAKGPYLWDVDGNRYVDCVVNNGACILGHNDPDVSEAVRRQLKSGLTVSLESEMSVRVAKLLADMIPSAEVVKFSNTGTEAIMHAIHIARGYSGREKIAKLEGGYNGWYDYVSVSTHPKLDEAGPASNPVAVPASGGLVHGARDTVILPFNDIDNTTRIIRQHKDELAAVLIEPVMFNVGCVLPNPEYLKAVRELTDELGIVLIFDEVISGFQLAPGGAQAYYHVVPDISAFAKAIANGFPLAAVVGKHEFMDITDPKSGRVGYAGTYNGNQMSLAASHATLSKLKTGKIQRRLHESTSYLRKSLADSAKRIHVDATLVCIGGKFQVYFMREEPTNYRTAIASDHKKYVAFRNEVVNSGVLMHPTFIIHHGITAAHTKRELQAIGTAMQEGLRKAKDA